MKALKKNQVIIYVIALMLVAAGYLNYTADDNNLMQTSTELEYTQGNEIANIGDAKLVNSNDIAEEQNTNTITETEQTETTPPTITEEMPVENTETNETTETNTETVSDDYFEKSKLERETMYSKMLESYQNILNSTVISEEQKSIATQEITNINNTNNSIMVCENLIKTKGFNNCIVFVNGDSVSVVVETTGELTPENVAQIQNIVSRELSVEIENINISSKIKSN